jgi:hypothetical protein
VATTHTTQCTNLLAEASLAQRDLDNFVSRMDEEMQALGKASICKAACIWCCG